MADIPNYNIDVATPFQAALQGYQAGAAIRDDQAQQAAKQAALANQKAMQQDIGMVLRDPNASPSQFAALTLKYPAMKDQFKQANDMVSADQRQNFISHGTQVYAALAQDQPDIAKQLLTQRAAAMRNSGDQKGAAAIDTISQMIDVDPKLARNMIAFKLNGMDDKFAQSVSTLGQEGRAEAQAPVDLATKKAELAIKGADAAAAPLKVSTDIANTQSQITERAKRLGLDTDKLTTETQLKLTELKAKNGDLPEYVAKDVNAAATDAIAAQQSAAKMTSLASQIEKESASQLGGMSSGVAAQQWEFLKKTMGLQNETTRLRAEYSRIVTPAAMAAYKQVAAGSTSDKDIETAMVGVPKDTDSPERMVSFLRGAAKLQVYESALNNAKSEWLGAVRTLGKAKTDTEIDGVKVPAGMSFKEFTDVYMPRKVIDTTNASVIKASPYAEFGAPPVGAGPR